jgi:hypothetical protein
MQTPYLRTFIKYSLQFIKTDLTHTQMTTRESNGAFGIQTATTFVVIAMRMHAFDGLSSDGLFTAQRTSNIHICFSVRVTATLLWHHARWCHARWWCHAIATARVSPKGNEVTKIL